MMNTLEEAGRTWIGAKSNQTRIRTMYSSEQNSFGRSVVPVLCRGWTNIISEGYLFKNNELGSIQESQRKTGYPEANTP